MKIYFAAHGTTTDNEGGIASGWKDVELSELGRRQAKQLGEVFKNIKLDLVCCSDLRRAVDTVQLAFEGKLPVISDARLRELNYGDLNGNSSELVGRLKMAAVQKPFPNGESYQQAMLRVREFYQELKQKHPDKTVLVVGHRATQYGLDTLEGKSLEGLVGEKFIWQPFWEYDI